MWEFKSKTLVTLCKFQEDGKESFFPFWPTKENEKVKYGKVHVTLQSATSYDQFTQHKYTIHDEKVNLPVVVRGGFLASWYATLDC